MKHGAVDMKKMMSKLEQMIQERSSKIHKKR